MSKEDKFALRNNYWVMSQEEIDKEIEYEKDVDLAKTMW
jgi:hypothetical protein